MNEPLIEVLLALAGISAFFIISFLIIHPVLFLSIDILIFFKETFLKNKTNDMNEPNARAICDVKVTKDKDPYNVKLVKLLAEQLAASDKALNEAMERIRCLEANRSGWLNP